MLKLKKRRAMPFRIPPLGPGRFSCRLAYQRRWPKNGGHDYVVKNVILLSSTQEWCYLENEC
jgi:hypothetical protein